MYPEEIQTDYKPDGRFDKNRRGRRIEVSWNIEMCVFSITSVRLFNEIELYERDVLESVIHR